MKGLVEYLIDDIKELKESVKVLTDRVETLTPLATPYLSIDQVAKILHLKKETIYGLTGSRKLPHYKLGRRLLFSIIDIENFLATKKILTEDDVKELADMAQGK